MTKTRQRGRNQDLVVRQRQRMENQAARAHQQQQQLLQLGRNANLHPAALRRQRRAVNLLNANHRSRWNTRWRRNRCPRRCCGIGDRPDLSALSAPSSRSLGRLADDCSMFGDPRRQTALSSCPVAQQCDYFVGSRGDPRAADNDDLYYTVSYRCPGTSLLSAPLALSFQAASQCCAMTYMHDVM